MRKRAPIKHNLSAEYVRGLFHYDPETGFLYHKKRHGVVAGKRAGYVNSGYRSVKINQCAYLEHRIIWLLVTGEWPENDIDHADLNKTNNAWTNLRDATRSQNALNGPIRTARKYGTMKGAFYKARCNNWQAQIRAGNTIHLGTFATEAEAHAAYVEAAEKLAGKFARAG
jgi:hypothetical protein